MQQHKTNLDQAAQEFLAQSAAKARNGNILVFFFVPAGGTTGMLEISLMYFII